MPPEALIDKPKYDTPLDVFSFGHLSLYVALQQFPRVYELPPDQSFRALQLGEVAIHKRKKWLTAANVLLTDDLGQAKIADLGVLRLWDSYVNMEHKNSRALAHLPQEAFLDNPKRTTPIDVFSFGHLALYVALQRFPEISEEKVLTVTRKKREIEILKRKKWIDELKQDHCLRDLILQCLKDEPEKRPTAKELNNNVMSILNNATNPERKTKVHNYTLNFVLSI